MVDKIRWGIISTARIGEGQVIPAIQASRNGIVTAVASRDLEKGKPCPVCGSTRHPKIAALPKDHITEKQLEEREKALTAQRLPRAADGVSVTRSSTRSRPARASAH